MAPRTAQSYLAAALAASASSRPDLLVTASGEVIDQLNTIVEDVYAAAALANPPVFHGQADVPYSAAFTLGGLGVFNATVPAGWAQPDDCIRVYRIEVVAATLGVNLTDWPPGSEIIPKPEHDRTSNPYQPCVVESGRSYLATGVAGHPDSGDIRLLYAGRPVPFGGLASGIDFRWSSAHDTLIQMALATWLAQKDGRQTDAEAFANEASGAMQRFLAAIDSPTMVTRDIMARFRGNLLTKQRDEGGGAVG